MAEQFIASKQLPYVLQSTKLKNFFDSTVDQWFKNENSDFEKGFVGQKQGRLLNSIKDSYLKEPSFERTYYQLEPTTIIRNADTQTISYQTTYDDLVNKVRFDGGNIKNHARLFESKYYSYSPPIDIDKYLNYSNYYWYPPADDLSSESGGAFTTLPSKPIDGTSSTAIVLPGDVIGQRTYTAPDGTVLTNGLHIRFEGSHITGTSYQFYHKINSLAIGTAGTGYAVGDNISISGNVVGKVKTVNGSGAILSVEIINSNLNDGDAITTPIITSSAGTTAVITSDSTRIPITFIVEGVGTEIKLVDTRTLRSVGDSTAAVQDYITMQRGAKDGNLWSKSNGWVHKDTLENYPSVTSDSATEILWDAEPNGWDSTAWDTQIVQSTTAFSRSSARRALRPIIEFERDIELYDYGLNHLTDVTVVEPLLSKTQVEGNANLNIDGHTLQNEDTILFINAASQDDYVEWDGTGVLWDHDTDSDATTGGGGGTGGDVGWDVSSTEFTVGASIWKVSGVGSSIVLTQLTSSVKTNDKVYIEKGDTNKGTEWYFDGYFWNQAQTKTASNSPPLFNLYDNDKALLSDAGKYSSSDFAGSKIFGYKVGTGTNDTELGFPLAYSSGVDRSDIQFCNFLNEDTYNYSGGNITGYNYYKQYTYPETIAKIIDYEVNVNPNQNGSGNRYYINGQQAPSLILVRGNTYNFKFSSPESSTTGYSNASHPFYISDSNTSWTSFTKTLQLNDVVTLKKGDVITQNNNIGVTATVKADVTKNATVILDQEINTQNAGQFITGASNTLLVNGVAMKTDPDSPGTPVNAYPNTFTQTGFNNEYTGGVTGSRAYYGGTSSVLKFKVPSNAPDKLYYHCGVHNKMGSSFIIVDNPVTTLAGATETNYKNEWITGTRKLSQRLIQEHTVSNRNINDNVILEVIPSSILDVEIFKNGDKQVFGTDFTVSNSVNISFTTPLAVGDFIKVFYKTNDPDPLKTVNYYEIPKNLENNASNENLGTATYSELFEHFKSIIRNQSGFVGAVNGSNNYRDTPRNISLGDVILQHNAPLLKAMAVANNTDLDIPEALRYTKDRYEEFQLKFLNAVNNIQNTNEINSLTTAQLVDKALASINIEKDLTSPFAYSNLIASGDRFVSESITVTATNRTWGTQSTFLNLNSVTQEVFNQEPGLVISSVFDPDTDFNTKALYVYKNNVQMVINHDYIVDTSSNGTKLVFLGRPSDKPQENDIITIRFYETIQPTWIPHTPASLGVGKIYQPMDMTDSTTYSSGTRNFVQCHDGSLFLKYGDNRDSALLELEKRIYNTMYHITSDQDTSTLYEINTIQPNKFNPTSWSRKEINDLLRPIFTRWTNENAVNYQENTGYAITVTLKPNANYVVSSYVASGYVPATSTTPRKFTIGEEVRGIDSGATGKVTAVSDDTNTVTISDVSNSFDINEVLFGSQSGVGRKIDNVNTDWRVLNYSSLVDQDGQSLPGHWRGIYRWYYGTDRPHTHPWEMLGFSQKPIWWDSYYAWTSNSVRTQLIDDIEQGIIRSGARENYTDRSYLDENNPYKKPGFSSYVPVNIQGKLLSPLQIGIISSEPSEFHAQQDWQYGDGAPVEHAFLTSCDYPYAIQQILYLANPGLYVEQLWNVDNISTALADVNQTIDTSTGLRPTNKNYYVHTETDANNVRYLRSGVQNFISDYIIFNGGNVKESFGDVIKNMQSNLMYRCAGFIDSTKLKIESEAYDSTSKSTNIIIPPEDINLTLYQGASIQEAAYTAVIVQVVNDGYKVYGYDITNPYFRTYVPIKDSASYDIRVGGKDISPTEYNPGVTYHKGEVVVYQQEFYQCTVPHTASSTDSAPDSRYWKKIIKLPQQGGTEVKNFTQYDYTQTVDVDYGTTFKTRQDVYNAIVGYGEYLEQQGWVFDNHNVDIGENMNMKYSAKEFLFWSLGKWKIGDYITLSPSASQLKFKPQSGVVQSLTEITNGAYSILNKEGYGLDPNQMSVSRDDDMVTVSHKQGIGIYALRLFVKETEHAITLNNSTIFNDTIYNTLLAQRQPRVKISTVRTGNWTGKLEADGFIINNTSLINNFEKSVKDTLNFYDVDAEKVDTDFRDAAMHLIGFQERDYLTNLGVSKRNQVKLYQGMIKQKGTTNAIDRLLRSTTVSTDQDFDTYEEWAFKVGEFGSTNFNQQIELRLRAEDVVTDPLMFEFVLPTDSTATTGYDSKLDETVTIDIDDTTRWLKKPTGEKTLANLWPTVSTVESNIPSAGYVHFDDSTYQAYDSIALDNLYGSQTGNVTIGSSAWVAKDVEGGKDWNAYKLYELDTKIDNIISNGDANTAMKVTVNGTGATIGSSKKVILHKTYDGNGTLVIDPTTWGTHILTLNPSTPTAPTVTIPFANVAGSGAQLAVGNIAGTVATVTSTGGSGFATGDVITFTGTTGSGASATVAGVNAGAPTSYTLNSGGSNYSAAPNGFTVKDSSGNTKTIATGDEPTFTFTGSGTGGVFGEIKDLVITNGGTNYQAPSITIKKSDGSSITISSGITTNGSGTITAITVPSYSGSFSNQGFSAGITSTATGSIIAKDTRTNYTVNLNTQLSKVHALGNLTANVTTAWDGTAPSVVIESWDGATATTLYTVPTANLQSVASSNISVSGSVVDNSNVIVRANVSVTSATAGGITLTLNYTSKEYDITKTDGTAEFVKTVDNTTINSSGIKLLDWKDIRLNKILDSSTISTTVENTLNNFLTATGLSSGVWSEGDLVWLDDDSTGKWGVYRFTANASIISTYNTIRGSETTALSPSYGGTWILHSGVDYDKPIQTTAEFFASTKRRQQDKVLTDQFEKAVLYDDRTNNVELTLVPYDPAKGILPPSADREIEYKAELDPAIYNNHSDANQISTSKPWMDEYVGQVWWDLSTVRYIDYESHDNAYRRTYWGRLFPGATVDIYEWVSSKVAPANYTGSGTVKSTTNYSTKVITDSAKQITSTTYYFWVKNVTTVPSLEGRTNDTATVSSVITSPITQGLNYFAPISQNSISIANVLDFTTKENTVLQLNYRKRNTNDRTNSTHAQWLLIKEQYPDAPIQDQIWNKMVDSVIGFDIVGNTVPDMTLSLHDRYGSNVRPRQSWFKDSKSARKVLHESLNSITTSILLDVNHFGWDDDLTTAKYYEKTNWYYNTSFNDDTVIDRIVDYYADIKTSELTRDDVIKVNNGYNSKWELWQYTDADFLAGTTTTYDESNLSLVRIGLQTATAKLKTNVYTEADSTTMATELRAYIKALKDNVLIAQNLKFQNELLFAMIRYVNSEQPHVDWLFKSTYINIIQKDKALTQKASFEKDPFDDIRTYIEEVKPYRSKIRNFLSKKSPVREDANMAMSDFTNGQSDGTGDYVINSGNTGTTNPTPKVNTKLVFDRVSTEITLADSSPNTGFQNWGLGTFTLGSGSGGEFTPTIVKYNGAYWQCMVAHTTPTVGGGITGYTQANPVVVTTNTAHGLSNGDVITIDKVLSNNGGSTVLSKINGIHKISNITSNTFEIADVDSSNFFPYDSNGLVGTTTFPEDVEAGKWQHSDFEPRIPPTDASKISTIKATKDVTKRHVDRLAKYFYANELANVDISDSTSVSTFVSTLATKTGTYKDLDIQPIGFKVNRDRIGQELTTFAWDSLDWDATAVGSNPTMGYDYDNVQNWYEGKFLEAVNKTIASNDKSTDAYGLQTKQGTIIWTKNVAYTKGMFARHNDLTHIAAWDVSNSYTVGDIVKHNGAVYVAKVTHKNLAVGINDLGHKDGVDETNLVPSRWDLIPDLIYYATRNHTSTNSATGFKTDYDAGKWVLVQSYLDSNGFARPQHDPYPEEFAPIKPKELLLIKVNSCDATDSSKAPKTITGATKSNPVVITSTGHGFANGDQVVIAGLTATRADKLNGNNGMTQLNNNTYTVSNSAANTFELSGIDGTAFGEYKIGGIATPVINGTGDSIHYKVHYTPYGTVEYLRDKFVDDSGTPSSTDDHTTLNGAITKFSNFITVTDASKLPTPKQLASEIDDRLTNKPGVIWIGTERIEYSKKVGNVLSDIVRGTHGTTVNDHANGVEIYSGDTNIPNAGAKGFWNDASTELNQSTTEQANYLTNNENIVDYVSGDYVTPEDYVE